MLAISLDGGTRRIAPACSWLMLPLNASGFARKSAIIVRWIAGRSPPEIEPAMPYSVSPRANLVSRSAVSRLAAACGAGAGAGAAGSAGGGLGAAAGVVVGAAIGAAAGLSPGASIAGGSSSTVYSRSKRPRGQFTSIRNETNGSLIASRECTRRTLRPSFPWPTENSSVLRNAGRSSP